MLPSISGTYFRDRSKAKLSIPFNPANGTLTTLLRRTLVWDPELNPDPLLNAPPLFFFLRTLFTVSIFAFALLCVEHSKGSHQSHAVFLVALVLMSPNTASYTFLILLLPVALILENTSTRYKVGVLLCYVLLAVPMRPSWNWVFPKVWILMGMFWLFLLPYRIRPRTQIRVDGFFLALLASGFESAVYSRGDASEVGTNCATRCHVFVLANTGRRRDGLSINSPRPLHATT